MGNGPPQCDGRVECLAANQLSCLLATILVLASQLLDGHRRIFVLVHTLGGFTVVGTRIYDQFSASHFALLDMNA